MVLIKMDQTAWVSVKMDTEAYTITFDEAAKKPVFFRWTGKENKSDRQRREVKASINKYTHSRRFLWGS